MTLLYRIERHIRRHGTPPTTIGRLAVGDPKFVFDLRRGRRPGEEITRRTDAWLDAAGRREGAAKCPRR